MLKRNAAVFVVAGLVLAGGAVAWANGPAARPTVVTAAQSTDGTTPPAARTNEERRAGRAALRACLEAAGDDRGARQACFATAGVRPGRHPGRPGPHKAGLPFALGRAVHGTVIVPDGDGGWQEVTFDRGKVDEATDSSRIVLDRPDGPTVTIALTSDTRYHGIAGAADVVEGRGAVVVSRDGRALHVLQRDREAKGGRGNNAGPGGVPND